MIAESERAYLRDLDLAKRFGVHRCSIWRWCKEKNFPSPVRLSPGTTRWKLADVQQWEMAISS